MIWPHGFCRSGTGEFIDYYLELIPGTVGSSARKRIKLVSPEDRSTTTLSRKLLARPALLAEIRDLIPDLERSHIIPFLTTDDERELALRLGIPMYAADPSDEAFGTKSGCRTLFAELGVRPSLGHENLDSLAKVAASIADLRATQPAVERAILKLNDG